MYSGVIQETIGMERFKSLKLDRFFSNFYFSPWQSIMFCVMQANVVKSFFYRIRQIGRVEFKFSAKFSFFL